MSSKFVKQNKTKGRMQYSHTPFYLADRVVTNVNKIETRINLKYR